MAKTAMIRARTEPGLKKEVEQILHELGLSCTEAINIFFQQVRLRGGIPFEVKVPNSFTLKAIQDVRQKHKLIKTKDAKELFQKLGI
jgi:DNA-damage-inducible protein J